MERAWIISVGTELTLGLTADANAAWLAAQLAALGIRSERHVTVPDAAAAMQEVVLQAAASCDVVLITGGLGPTDDDLTRQVLADAAGVPLELDVASLEQIRAFFAARGRAMPERNRVQALIPRGGRVLPNTCGTAPGLRLELCGTPCFALPGVPFEMREMFAAQVAPELSTAARGAVLLSRRLHTFGLGESVVGEKIHDLMSRGSNPEVGTTARFGVVDVCISAAAADRPAAESLLERMQAEVCRRLGDVVFGRDGETLGGAVGGLLAARGLSLSTAESCTGGLVGTLLTDVPGSSRYYVGGTIAYANSAKINILAVDRGLLAAHGAVSRAAAGAMAEGAARLFGSDYALSLTGVAGPGGGSPDKPVGLVFVGLHGPTGTTTHEYRFASRWPREVIRMWAAHSALNLLRLVLLRAGAVPP